MATRPDTLAAALEVLAEQADPSVLARAQELVDAREARWIPDPEVDYVWALVAVSDPREGWLVVYIDKEDFEQNTLVFP